MRKKADKPLTDREIHTALNFLLVRLMSMEIKTSDGQEICPLFGYCPNCDKDNDHCFLERYMSQYPNGYGGDWKRWEKSKWSGGFEII